MAIYELNDPLAITVIRYSIGYTLLQSTRYCAFDSSTRMACKPPHDIEEQH